ncbi:hypothetical protein [Tsukamurella soli]|uniref:Transcriptional regulator AbmR n=1 Tax=Tsukamurella soli TaxID=644556 RepID=A0ABP8K8Q5_9ACTN
MRGSRAAGWQRGPVPDASDAPQWFAGRLPAEWFDGPAEVTVDRDEIVVVGTLPGTGESAAQGEGHAARFREETRPQRMRIADEAQARYERTVSWGVAVGDDRILFTHQAVPVMTRLRQPERRVLDTLVDAGVARSRADALAWCVRLVGEHTDEWLTKLREAMTTVDDLRAEGPGL